MARALEGFVSEVGHAIEVAVYSAAASFTPHPGLRWDSASEGYEPTLSWPWSFPIGPVTSTSERPHRCGRPFVEEHRGSRLLFEPGFAFARPWRAWLRPAYRFIWHPGGWKVGFGAGFGTTVELAGTGAPRSSLSPEVVLHLGECCGPGYLTFALRYDAFWYGEGRDVILGNVGFTVW